MSDHILAKQRIDSLIIGILEQNQAVAAVLAETASSSDEMAGTVSRLITGMQFQDRTKQHLGHVVDALGVLEAGAVSAQQATCDAYPGVLQAGNIDAEQLARIIEKQTLGAMKARILTRMLSGDQTTGDDPPGAGDSEAGDMELF